VIVEVEGYEGVDGEIAVTNFRAETQSFGVPDKIYCIGRLDPDGVVRFSDWGYATAEEARASIQPPRPASPRPTR
jgi:hypothetical protein